jgi:hypothetical protein
MQRTSDRENNEKACINSIISAVYAVACCTRSLANPHSHADLTSQGHGVNSEIGGIDILAEKDK